MTSRVVLLGDGGAVGADLGGKGASLARMVGWGHPVPRTAVVPISEYRLVASDPVLSPYLEALTTATEPPTADDVDRRFLAVPLPDGLEEAICRAAPALGPRIAVRSSASAEDLRDRSFAGQYRSLLDVPTTGPDLLRAIRLVWASLWHPAPWAYRRAWGIPQEDAAMAVVLMEMVPAEHSGVLFTVDPGHPTDDLRVELVSGLGETLVSGERTPDVWHVPRSGPLPDGAPGYFASLRDGATALEVAEGVPLDVEWAWDGGHLWLVQSRPITVDAAEGDGFDTPVDDHELTSAGISEMLPGVLPPLRWGVTSFLVEEAFRNILSSLHALPDGVTGPHAFVRRVRGRAVLDLDLLKEAAEQVPGASATDIEAQYFAEVTTQPTVAPHASWVRVLRRDLRAMATRRRSRFDGDVVIAVARAVDADPGALDLLDDRQLLSRRLRLLDLGVRAMTAELGVAAAAAGAYAGVEQVLGRYLDRAEAARRTQEVTLGATGVHTSAPTASRSVFAGPTWSEAPQVVVRDGARARPAAGRALADLEEVLVADPRWRRTRVLSGQVIDVRLHMLRRTISDAIEDLGRREGVKAAVLGLGGHVRLIHLEVGARLVARGLLDDAEDVELLSEEELRRGLLDGVAVPRGVLGRRRRHLARWREEDELPTRFTGMPPATESEPLTGDRLMGIAASPGRFTGRAVVVRDPTDAPPPPGSVIVARATDAAWSPLFIDAGAVVVERGGPLSHAAIVARELGLPAVLDVRGATRHLDGRTVTVDGSAGIVAVHEDEHTPPPTEVVVG
jgi:rifampicin phosphotransferase